MAVAGALRACRRVVLYGFSMGSYGALISARVLGADRLVLMAPVADIPPDRDRRWIGVYDQGPDRGHVADRNGAGRCKRS